MNKIHGVYRFQSKQWLAALAASMAMINVGNEEFWVWAALRNVNSSDSALHRNKNLLWAGLFAGGTCAVLGAVLGAVLSDRFGRIKALSVTGFLALGQIMSTFISNGILSCVALYLGLIGLGLTRVVVPLYISEIVDDDIRGTLLMLQLPFFYVGKLILAGIGKSVSSEIVGVISLISTSTFLIILTRLPETPYYLASKKRDDAATKSLAFYRGIESYAAENEINEITKKDSQGYGRKIQELIRPTNRKGFVIILFLIIAKWSEQIFDQRDELTYVVLEMVSSEYLIHIIVNATSLITSCLIVFTIDVIGRRSFLLYSNFVGFIVMIIAVVLVVRGNHIDKWVDYIISITLHLCQQIYFSMLLVYIGELFSSNVKALAIAILTTFDLLISFVIILMPEFMIDVRSRVGGILLLVAFPITFAFIPETKRKSYSEIQGELATMLHCRWLMKKLT